MEDVYITLQSDSSEMHFPNNNISNFRNRFAVPLIADRESYEVALVECSYVHSNTFISSGELLFHKDENRTEPGHYADRDIHTLAELIECLKKLEVDLTITNGTATRLDPIVWWAPKLYNIIGYHKIPGKGPLPIHMENGNTQIYVYCDIVDLQRVGSEMVPLLRKMDYKGKHAEVLTRSFLHLQYMSLSRSDIDCIHLYIKNEEGRNLPFTFGSFSATLHFRRKRL